MQTQILSLKAVRNVIPGELSQYSIMKVRFALFMERITSHFWIIPLVITFSLMGFLFYIKQYRIFTTNPILEEIFFLKAKPEAVRLLLSSISTSIMTVLGVVFSITIVVIQNMSNQYTPRVVANFTRSKIAQLVLGFYVGTFSYCLILLMNIGDTNTKEDPIPRFAVAFGGVLAIFCLILLIVFIHQVTKSIQSTEIIKNISAEAVAALRNIITDRENKHRETEIRRKGFPYAAVLTSCDIGYIDSIHWAKIPEVINTKTFEVHFHQNAGNFVQRGMELLTIWTDYEIDNDELIKLREIFEVHASRTISQDPTYGIQKLSDIALKALSPGINDPSTAMESIHAITTLLLEYLRNFPIRNRVHLDEDKVIIFLPMDGVHLIRKGYENLLPFVKDHQVVSDLIRDDMRFLRKNIVDKDLQYYIDQKVGFIQ